MTVASTVGCGLENLQKFRKHYDLLSIHEGTFGVEMDIGVKVPWLSARTEKFERPIFLRSPELEYEDIHKKEEKMEENFCDWQVPRKIVKNPLEYTPVTGIKLDCPPNYRSMTLNPYTYGPIGPWEPQPQFWYDARTAHKGPTWPVGNPDDYRFKALEAPQREKNKTLEAMEIERPERYIPGEIYKNKEPKEPVEDLSSTGGCSPTWAPKRPEVFNAKFDPSTLPPQPLFADYVKEMEKIHRGKLSPADPSVYKMTETYDELMKKHRFRSQDGDPKDMAAENIKSEQQYHEVTKTFMDRCQRTVAGRCKPIWRTEKKCSCCDSKYV